MSKDRKVESQIDAARKQYFKSLKEYKKLTESGNVEAGRPGRYPVVMSLEAFEGAVWNVQVKINLNNSRSQYAEALIGLIRLPPILPPTWNSALVIPKYR